MCLQIRRTYSVAPVCTATPHAEGRVAVAVRQGPGERRTILANLIAKIFPRSCSFFFSKETREFRSLRIFRDPFCYLILFYFIRVFSTSYEGSYYLARVFGNNDIRSSKEEYINL